MGDKILNGSFILDKNKVNFPSLLFVHSFYGKVFEFYLKSNLAKDKVDFRSRLFVHFINDKIFEFELRSIFLLVLRFPT